MKHDPHSVSMTHYRQLLIMASLSFPSMYVLMYAMVNRISNVYLNVNQMTWPDS